jgi:hypothetical protein
MTTSSNPHKPAAVAASGGVLAGLVTIFLPLLQALPSGVTPGEVQTAVAGGVALIIASIGGYLVHHGVITKAELTAGTSYIQGRIPAIEADLADLPAVKTALADTQTVAASAQAKVAELEAKLPGSASLVSDAETVGLNALSKLLGGRKLLVADGGTLTIPVVAVATPPAAPAPEVAEPAPEVVSP